MNWHQSPLTIAAEREYLTRQRATETRPRKRAEVGRILSHAITPKRAVIIKAIKKHGAGNLKHVVSHTRLKKHDAYKCMLTMIERGMLVRTQPEGNTRAVPDWIYGVGEL